MAVIAALHFRFRVRIAEFSNAGGSKLCDVENDANFTLFDPPREN